jgi:catechol 2,3-dioxygenase-like lactoylglutathione lyase family enzyme
VIAQVKELPRGSFVGEGEKWHWSMLAHRKGSVDYESVLLLSRKPVPIPPNSRWGDIGFNDITLRVTGLSELYRNLGNKGVKLLSEPRKYKVNDWTKEFFYLQDPDGINIKFEQDADDGERKPEVFGYHYTCIGVTDLEASLRFYDYALGLSRWSGTSMVAWNGWIRWSGKSSVTVVWLTTMIQLQLFKSGTTCDPLEKRGGSGPDGIFVSVQKEDLDLFCELKEQGVYPRSPQQTHLLGLFIACIAVRTEIAWSTVSTESRKDRERALRRPATDATGRASMPTRPKYVADGIRPFPGDHRPSTLDSLGCSLGGAQTAVGQKYIATAGAFGGNPESTVIGGGARISCIYAAYVNSLLNVALDYDDTYLYALSHPGGPVIHAALAAADMVHASGKEFLTAIITGYEVSIRIGRALRSMTLEGGLRRVLFSSAFTVFGAAASAGKLMGLDESGLIQRLRSLGISSRNPSRSLAWETPPNWESQVRYQIHPCRIFLPGRPFQDRGTVGHSRR